MKIKEFKNINLEIPSQSEGAELISTDYFNSFFPYITSIDMEIRMGKSLAGLTFQEKKNSYISFIQNEVLNFTEEEVQKVESCFADIDKMLTALNIKMNPKNICLIKTSGKEEGTKGYTRNNCIIVTNKKFEEANEKGIFELKQFLTHELFHVFSRYNPKIRFQLYRLIGFENNERINISSDQNEIRVTNPDAANFRFSIDWKDENGNVISYVPFVFSKLKAFDPALNLGMFGYIETGYCPLDKDNLIDTTKLIKVLSIRGQYEIAITKKQREETPDNYEHPLYEVISKNSGYIMHPEEISADNFSLLLLSAENPKLLEGITPLGKSLQTNFLKTIIHE